MRTSIFISFLIFLFVGCVYSESDKEPESKTMTIQSNDKDIIDSLDLDQKDTVEHIIHSGVFNKFLKRVKNDGYNIDTIPLAETKFYSFDRRSEFDDTLLNISVPNVNERYYKLKRKKPTVKEGDTYPRFTLTEFYFENETKAQTMKSKIDSIINWTDRIDLINEKNYDYCVQFSNRIIYVACNSMYLSTYSNDYKIVIEGLIK